MKKRVATARTVSAAIRGTPGVLRVKRIRRPRLGQVYTVNEAGKRGLHHPPAQ
jgi:hypothetical protein